MGCVRYLHVGRTKVPYLSVALHRLLGVEGAICAGWKNEGELCVKVSRIRAGRMS